MGLSKDPEKRARQIANLRSAAKGEVLNPYGRRGNARESCDFFWLKLKVPEKLAKACKTTYGFVPQNMLEVVECFVNKEAIKGNMTAANMIFKAAGLYKDSEDDAASSANDITINIKVVEGDTE